MTVDLVPSRSGKAYAVWLDERDDALRMNVTATALDPPAGHKTAINDKFDAVAVIDASHVEKLSIVAVDHVRRRVQQDSLGHGVCTGHPLYWTQTVFCAVAENLTQKQRVRLVAVLAADPAHDEIFVARQCTQPLRSTYHAKDLVESKRIAEKIVGTIIIRDDTPPSRSTMSAPTSPSSSSPGQRPGLPTPTAVDPKDHGRARNLHRHRSADALSSPKS